MKKYMLMEAILDDGYIKVLLNMNDSQLRIIKKDENEVPTLKVVENIITADMSDFNFSEDFSIGSYLDYMNFYKSSTYTRVLEFSDDDSALLWFNLN